MAKPNPHRPFTPDPEQMSLWPDVSGNDVNGLGEPDFRRARMVYWATNLDDIAHGPLQGYFGRRSSQDTRFTDARIKRQAVFDAALPDMSPQQNQDVAQDWALASAIYQQDGLCEKLGVTQVNPDWVIEGFEVTLPNVVMIAVQHNYDQLSQAPEPEAGLEVMEQYRRAALAAKTIAGWLRDQGWQADPLTGPMTSALTMIPPALACGFGELGKHGSIINPEFGAAFRLSAVLTDAPLTPTPPQDHGIDAFCQSCRICEDACPPAALSPDKQTVRGTRKWYVDFDKCLPFFNQTHGCAICIAVCPWSRPGVGLNLAAKLARKREREAAS